MAKKCLSLKAAWEDPQFVELMGRYSGYHDAYILSALTLYREMYDKDDDYYPRSPQEKAAFTKFVSEVGKRSMDAASAEMSRQELIDMYAAASSAFSPSERAARVNMIGGQFLKFVRGHLEKHPGMSVAQAVAALGGFDKIMDRVFNVYSSYTEEMFLDRFNKSNPGEENLENNRKKARYRAEKFRIVVENRKRLEDLVRYELSDILSTKNTWRNENADEDNNTVTTSPADSTEETTESSVNEKENMELKGDRYIDYRLFHIHETLSNQVKIILSGIRAIDDTGTKITDDLGVPVYLDYKQASFVLVSMFEVTEPREFMQTIEENADSYPWLASLHEYLQKHPDDQAVFFSSFKRAKTVYDAILYDRKTKKYSTTTINKVSGRRSVHKKAASLVSTGVKLDPTYSVYGNNQTLIITPDLLNEVKTKLASGPGKFRTMLNFVDTRIRKGFSASDKEKYKAKYPWVLEHGNTAATMFMQEPGVEEWLLDVTKMARGIGFDVTPAMIKSMLAKPISVKTSWRKGFERKTNRLAVFINGLLEAYNKAADVLKAGQNSTYFISVASDAFSLMGDALAPSLSREVENRALSNNKSLGTWNSGNLLHDEFNRLTNAAGLSRTTDKGNYNEDSEWVTVLEEGEFEKTFREEIVECEGMGLYDPNEPGKVRAVGWQKDILDNREYGEHEDTSLASKYKGPISLVQETEFNGVTYDRLSADQKRLSDFIMWYNDSNGKKTAKYSFLIQSDYTNAWDFVRASIYPTGRTVDEIAEETVGNTTSELFKTERARLIEQFGSTREPLSYTVKNEEGKEITVYNTNSEIVERFADEVSVEFERIRAIEERQRVKNRTKLTEYEERGSKFIIFPELNNNGFKGKYILLAQEDKKYGTHQLRDFVKQQVAEQLAKRIEADYQDFVSGEIPQSELLPENGDYGLFEKVGSTKLSPWGKDVFQQYSANFYYARIQMTKMFMGSLAFFDGIPGFEKRSMFTHAPGTPFYTEATYNGKKAGKDTDNVLYVGDDVSVSSISDEIAVFAETAKNLGLIDERTAEYMKHEYMDIKTTDGQGLRSFESYREMRIQSAASQWTDLHEKAYQRIMDGTASKEDIAIILKDIFDPNGHPIYNENQKYITTGYQYVKACDSISGNVTQRKIRIPTTHKYSEAVLLPTKLLEQSGFMNSEVLRAFNLLNERLNKENKIDLFLFGSNVKVGLFNRTNPLEREGGKPQGKLLHSTAEEMANVMETDIQANEETIHRIPRKYTRVTASMPPHVLDTEISLSSQAMKHALSNLDPDDILRLPGGGMTSIAARNLLDLIETTLVIDEHHKLEALLMDADKVNKLIQTELGSKPYNSSDLSLALTQIVGKGGKAKYAMPLFSSSVRRKAEELLNSVFKKRMSSIYTRGSGVVQVSSIGYDKENIPGAPEGFVESNRDKLGVELEYEETKNNEGKVVKRVPKRIKWIDCYMSIHDSRLLKYAAPDGSISPKTLRKLVKDGIIDERLLFVTAYRNPADAEHSILPLRIKGFLPSSSGANIIVAKEAMKMTGHDYDGDKLRCHYQEFRSYLDKKSLLNVFRKNPGYADTGVLRDVFGTELPFEPSDKFVEEKEFLAMVQKLPDDNAFKVKFIKTRLVEYDYSKPPQNQSVAARKNGILQIMFAAVTSENGTLRALIPGGAEETNQHAKTIQLVKEYYSNENVKELLAKSGINKSLLEKDDIEAIYTYIDGMESKKRNALFNELSSLETPFSVAHSVKAHQYMMAGTQMTSIYAMYSSSAALLQRLNLAYKPMQFTSKNNKTYTVDVKLFGKELGPLFRVQTTDSKGKKRPLQTLVYSRFLNTAVDNGKDPLLGLLNQYPEVAKLTFLLYAAGLEEEEIDLIMNQPVMIEYVKRLKSTNSLGTRAELEKIIEELSPYGELVKESKDAPKKGKTDAEGNTPRKLNTFYQIKEFNKNKSKKDYILALPAKYENFLNDKHKTAASFQLGLACTIEHLLPAAAQLDDLVHVVRPETRSSGVGPTNAMNEKRISQLNDLQDIVENKSEKRLAISGMEPIVKKREIFDGMATEGIIDELMRGTEETGQILPVVARNELMLRWTQKVMSRYFPAAKESTAKRILSLAKEYDYAEVQEGIIDKIGEEAILYMLLSSPAYKNDLAERHTEIVIEFPKRLQELQQRIADAKTERNKYEGEGKYVPSDSVADSLIGQLFLDKLDVRPPESTTAIPRIAFQSGGVMVEHQSEEYRRSWSELMHHPDTKIRKLAIDLFDYNLLTSGFGFGMYEFLHFAPLDVILSNTRYLKAADSVMDYEFTDDEWENFRHMYYMNHFGDKRLVPRYGLQYLSQDALDMLGIKGTGNTSDNAISKNDITEPYIVVADKDNNMMLYRRVELSVDSYTYERAEKLGVRNASGQMSLYFDPNKSYKDIQPLQVGVDSSWGDAEAIKTRAEANKPYNWKKQYKKLKDRREDVNAVAKESAKKKAIMDMSVQEIAAAFNDFGTAAEEAAAVNKDITDADDDVQFEEKKYAKSAANGYEVSTAGDKRFSALVAKFKPGTMLFGHDVGGRTIESVYQNGVKQGDWTTDSNTKTGAPRSNEIIHGNTPDDSYRDGYLPLWQEWARQNPELITDLRVKSEGKVLTDRFVGSGTTVSQARALADILNAASVLDQADDITSDIPEQGSSADVPEPSALDSIPEAARAAILGSGKFLSIARRNGTNVTVEKVPVTPANVLEARRQKTYVELNKYLREILSKHNISVGVLSSFEARLGIEGVADFDTATVTAEGMYEMIRLNEGVRGEQALPEEFSHLAVEMLGHNHPLVSRLLNAIERTEDGLREAFGDLYDDYMDSYGNDMEKMVIEAAGKLIAKQLFLQKELETKPLRRLVSRVVDAIKYMLSKFSADEIKRAIYEANHVAANVASGILSGRLLDQMSMDNIEMNTMLYKKNKVKTDISNRKGVLNSLLMTEIKRQNNLEKKANNSNPDDPLWDLTVQQIAKLKQSIKEHRVEDAVLDYLGHTSEFLVSAEQDLNDVVSKYGVKANTVCRKVYAALDTLESFVASLEYIREAMRDGELEASEELVSIIDTTAGNIGRFQNKCYEFAQQESENALSEVYGEHGIVQTIGKDKGKRLTPREILKRAPKDISWVSRYVHSLSDCNDLLLKAVAEMVRKVKDIARRKTENTMSDVSALMSNLVRETGSSDQTFMFEYEDGKKTGKFITKKQAESLPKAQRDFYFGIRKILDETDKLLPEGTRESRSIIMMRKLAMQKAMEAPDVKTKAKYLHEAAKDQLLDMSDDAKSPVKEVEVDFFGNRVDHLNILFTRKGEKETYDDMTDDVATSVLAYVNMANEYSQLDSIVGKIEVLRFMSSRREVGQRTGLRMQQETAEDINTIFHRPYTVKQAKTHIQQALNDFITMHVYGHYHADEGNIGNTNISIQKLAGSLNSYASFTQMAFNAPQRISNVAVGLSSIAIETAAKGSMSAKNVGWAMKEYGKHLDALSDAGSFDGDSFITLWRRRFDVGQDNGREFKNKKYSKSKVKRILGGNLAYAGLALGENFLSTITSFAVARDFKVKAPDGSIATLYDAYEPAYKDEKNKTGAYLKLKDGYTKEDGTPITQEDEYRFSKLCAGLSFDLQGIYNLNDRSAMQQFAGGDLIIMYRKWIAPALKRRYADVHYDILRDSWEEGYWRTTGRFIMDVIGGIHEDGESIKSSLAVHWDKLSEYEKANMKKALTEVSIIIGTFITVAAAQLLSLPDDDDEDKELTWLQKQVVYYSLRLRNELGAQAPTPLMGKEALKILKSPFAAMRPFAQAMDSLNFFLPWNHFIEIKKGRYAGHKKAYRYFQDMPFVAPFKHLSNLLDPTSTINYYKNGNF